jgi:acetyl esterase/lipase
VSSDPRAVLTRPAPPPDATLPYGDHPDQVADLRLPAPGAPPRPLVVVVHGGFWRQEYDRTHTGPLSADLAARGWPVAQLEYRRTGASGSGGWPGTFADVAAGLSLLPALVADVWPASGSQRHPGLARPLLVGHSAGGHLALWWAGRAQVRGVVALAPVTDLAEAHRLDLDGGAVAALLGGAPGDVPHRYAYASPGVAPHPVIVVHGSLDRQVPVHMSRAWAATTGIPLVELPDTEHFGLIDPLSSAWPTVVQAVERLAGVDQLANKPVTRIDGSGRAG